MGRLMDARASRRAALGTIGAAGVAVSLGDAGPAAAAQTPIPPAPDPANPLSAWWDRPVADLATLPDPGFGPEMQERHRIFALLLSATVAWYFNGNKRGLTGEYPWRKRQLLSNGLYMGGEYFGHNIACIAVDGTGRPIDFDFNHNDLFRSTVEHAESRLVRRVFSIASNATDWETRNPIDPPNLSDYGTILSDVTVYTSLESCSQCSGIMTLGRIKQVVFVQADPTQYSIGNILYNATGGDSPRPVSGREIGLAQTAMLEDGFREYQAKVGTVPFYRDATWTEDYPSITSFLCTDLALEAFESGAGEFESITLAYPDFAPARGEATPVP